MKIWAEHRARGGAPHPTPPHPTATPRPWDDGFYLCEDVPTCLTPEISGFQAKTLLFFSECLLVPTWESHARNPQQSSPDPTTTEASGEEKRALALWMEPPLLSEQRLGRKFLYL